jgi:hypothetical protein
LGSNSYRVRIRGGLIEHFRFSARAEKAITYHLKGSLFMPGKNYRWLIYAVEGGWGDQVIEKTFEYAIHKIEKVNLNL